MGSDKLRHSKPSDRPTAKILTMVIRTLDGHAECCFNWNIYDISVNCELKMICMQKMNVIAKIGCYFKRSVVTVKLRKEYLNIMIYNIPVYSG